MIIAACIFNEGYNSILKIMDSTTMVKNFNVYNGDESFEDEEGRGRHVTIDNEQTIRQLRTIIESIPLKITREVVQELNVDHLTVVCHLKQIGKSSINGFLRNRCYEICSALILRNKNNPFLDRIITCDEKWILYDNRRLDYDEKSKHFLKPKLYQKKIWPFGSPDLSPINFFKYLDTSYREKALGCLLKTPSENLSIPEFYANRIKINKNCISRWQRCVDSSDSFLN
ncbi:SETMR methyltransferase, partial [Acromyrmex insinuator]